MTIHTFLYEAIKDICVDREYLYASFMRAFEAFIKPLYKQGGVLPELEYIANGVKSNYDIKARWVLEHRINFCRQNAVKVTLIKYQRYTGEIEYTREMEFDISTGEEI